MLSSNNIGSKGFCILFILLSPFIVPQKITAATNTATAAGGGTWASATWNLGHIPLASEDAVINSGINLSVGTAAVCGSLTIGNATVSNTTLTIAGGGSLTVSGTTGNLVFNPNNVNRTFTLAVGAQSLSVSGGVTFPTTGTTNITISTGSATFTNAISLSTSDNISLTGAGSITFSGGLTDAAGSLSTVSGCTVNFGGNYTVSNAAVTWTAGANTIFTATATITPTAAITFSNIQFNTGTITLAGNITVAGNWTNNGAVISGGATTVTLSGAGKTIGGTASSSLPRITIASGGSYTMNTSNTCTRLTFAAGAPNSLTHSGAAALTVNGTVTVSNPTSNGTTAWNINGGSSTVSGTATIGSGGANASRIARINITTGVLSISTNLVFSAGNAASAVLDLTGGAARVNLSRAFTLSTTGTLLPGASSIFNYNGSAAGQTVSMTAATITYNDLYLNNTNAAGATLGAAVTAAKVTGNLTVQSGLFSNGGFAIAGNAGKTFSVSNGATFRLTGVSAMASGFGTKTFGNTSTVNYAGTAQAISAENYGHLTLSNNNTKTAGGALTVNGNLTISGSTQFAGGSSLTHNFYGNWVVNTTNASPFTFVTASTINMNTPVAPASTSISGTAAAVIAFNNINIKNTSGYNANHNFSASGNLNVFTNVVFTPGAANILSGAGTLTGSGDVLVTRTAATADFLNQYTIANKTLTNLTVDYNGSASQTINALNYFNLSSSNSGTRTLAAAGSIGVSGTFNPGANLYTITGSTVTMNGSSPQALAYQFTFNNLIISNAAGVSLSANQDIRGTLTMPSGNLTTTGYTLTFLSDASGTGNIGDNTGGGSITGNITMQRYVTGTAGYRMIGSPVTNATLLQLDDDITLQGLSDRNPSALPNIFYYDETTTGVYDYTYIVPASTGYPMTNGLGFSVYIWNAGLPATIDITGLPKAGSKTFTVSYTPTGAGDPINDGWNMIGNPYPSAINWDAAGWTKTNISPSIYIWDNAIYDYRYWQTGVGGTGSNLIGSTQAVWVQATGASPSLSCPENVKSNGNPAFYKMNSGGLPNLLYLSVSDINQYTDSAIIVFRQGATPAYDPVYDTHRMFSPGSLIPYLATMSSDKLPLAINSYPELSQDIIIPVRLLVNASGAYTFTAGNLESFPPNSGVTLEDKQTGIFTDLMSDSTYSFSMNVNTNPVDTATRFLLHFQPLPDGTHVVRENTENEVFIFNTGKESFADFRFAESTRLIMEIYNTLGQKEETGKEITIREGRVSIDLAGKAPGIYFVTFRYKDKFFTGEVISY